MAGNDVFLYAGQVIANDVVLGDPSALRPHEINLADSTFIAAGGGTATTAQLTPPSGKTTSNFSAMKISDDTNPITADIAPNFYGEPEWAFQAAAFAELVTYEFRVVVNGVTLNYTVTPVLTVTAGGGGSNIPAIMYNRHLQGMS